MPAPEATAETRKLKHSWEAIEQNHAIDDKRIMCGTNTQRPNKLVRALPEAIEAFFFAWDASDGEAAIARAADTTEGFSARELSKLAIAWQAQAYSTPDRVLTLKDFEEVIEITHAQNKLKKDWHEMALERKRKREERLAAMNRRDPIAMKTALAAAARAAEEVEARFLVPNLALRTAEGVVRSS